MSAAGQRAPRARHRLATALIACLGLTACGSSGPVPGSKADYITRADAICAANARQYRTLPAPRLGGTPSQVLGGLAAYVDRIRAVSQRTIDGLRALPRPAQDGALLARYLRALDRTEISLKRLSAAAHRGDRAGVRAGARSLTNQQANRLALRYGLRRCASGATGAAAGRSG